MLRRAALVVLASLCVALASPTAASATPSGDVTTTFFQAQPSYLAGTHDGSLLIGTRVAIVRISPDRRSTTFVAGTGQPCDPYPCGQSGPASSTPISAGDVAEDPRTGTVYFVEYSRVRKVENGQVSTVVDGAGTICQNFPTAPCGDGGPAIDAQTGIPQDLGVGPDGSLYVLDDKRVRRVAPDGTISTIAHLRSAGAMAVGPDGRVALMEPDNVRIWKDGVETKLAGAPGETAVPATFCFGPPDPCGDDTDAGRFWEITSGAFDALGDLIVAERGNEAIRRISPDGHVTRIAGLWQRCVFAETWPCTADDPARRGPVDAAQNVAVAGDDVFAYVTSSTSRGARIVEVVDGVHAPPVPEPRYRFIGSDGGVFDFGWAPFWGSTGDMRLNQPVVGGAATGAYGYWLVAADGGMFTFGDAVFRGAAVGQTTSPVVAMAATPDRAGYYLLERTGRVHAFGSAVHRGDAQVGRSEAVGIAAAADGSGYWVALANGNVQAFGAPDRGPASVIAGLKAPIVGIAAAGASGFWLVAGDGGVFTFGAGFYGSTGALRLNQPIVDIVASPSGGGYWLVAADGGVFSFGDAPFLGSTGSLRLNRPIVAGMATS